MLLGLFGVKWVMAKSIKALFSSSSGVTVRNSDKDRWMLAPTLVSCGVFGRKGTQDILRCAALN